MLKGPCLDSCDGIDLEIPNTNIDSSQQQRPKGRAYRQHTYVEHIESDKQIRRIQDWGRCFCCSRRNGDLPLRSTVWVRMTENIR